jgi:hypothetical protein
LIKQHITLSLRHRQFSKIDPARRCPKGRDGKHKPIVSKLLSDLDQLAAGSALKIPMTALPDTKENIRSALNRVTNQRGMEIGHPSDAEFLYIWRTEQSK